MKACECLESRSIPSPRNINSCNVPPLDSWRGGEIAYAASRDDGQATRVMNTFHE